MTATVPRAAVSGSAPGGCSPYPGRVFGRTRDNGSAPVADASMESSVRPAETAGKGRPTPKRRDVEQRNRRPVIGARKVTVKPGATREERKAAKRAQREADLAQRQRSRAGMASGDERFLAARDRGP